MAAEYTSFTDEDIAFIRANYQTMKYSKIAEILNRSVESIRSKIKYFKLNKTKFWTDVETDFLIQNHKIISIQDISIHLNRGIRAIDAKLRELKLICPSTLTKFLPEDDMFLIQNFQHMSDEELGAMLNKTTRSVTTRRNYLKLCHRPSLTEEQIEFVTQNNSTMSHRALGEAIGVGKYIIQRLLKKIGLRS